MKFKMKRIATIQDVSCVGKCSLTVALPIISAMGVETAIIPTAVLSTHTMFKGFTFHDLTTEIQPICDHWKREGISFDALYTGYLGSFEQLELMKKLFNDFGKGETLTIVDPCMADNGKLYPGFSEEFPAAMKTLCDMADIITPNITEACLLLGIPYIGHEYTLDTIKDFMLKLTDKGAKKVVLKGIELADNCEFGCEKGKIGILSYDREKGCFDGYFHEKMQQSFHGTGDIFASVLTGALMRGKNLKQAYTLAGDFVVEAIKATLAHEDHNIYGVDFETAIPFLIKNLA